jgi:hypothetical protein
LGGGTVAAEIEVLQDVSDVNASMLASHTYALIQRYLKAD